ncbi:MAG: class I SAM-dependent methyltransferase [Bacteroidaceae bacterium]|nr:class I SAM-dependent methyltransferase [Bacteroidaceae bacterium]
MIIGMESKAHFDKIADNYENLRPVFTPVMNNLAKVLEIKENDVVVDFGCGPGHDIKYLVDNYKITPIAVDKSKEMCRVASSKIGVSNVINGYDLSCLRNVVFDKIYFKFVMHHIIHPLQFVDDLVNSLKKGDSFAIVTMLPSHLESYKILKYFPFLIPIFKTKAQEQKEVFEHLRQNRQVRFNFFDCDINEEVFDNSLLNKLENNYSSFFSILPDDEKKQGMEKIKNQLNPKYNHKYITKGVIGYGRKQ